MTFRRLIALLTIVVLAVADGDALAQSALSGQIGTDSDPAFPPVNGSTSSATIGGPLVSPLPSNGAAPAAGGFGADSSTQSAGPSQDCMKQFMLLREDAQKRGNMIKAAGDRHAAPDEACKLIKNFAQAEVGMLNYVEAHATKCGIPSQVADQLKAGHKNTEALQTRVCNIAQRMQQRGPTGGSDDRMVLPVGDFPPYYGLTPR
jgi:hypothetical protein